MQRSRLLAPILGLAALGAGMLGTGCGTNGVVQPTVNPGAIPNILAQNQSVFTPTQLYAAIPSVGGVTNLIEDLTNVNATLSTGSSVTTVNPVNSLAGGSTTPFTNGVGLDLFAVCPTSAGGQVVPLVEDQGTGVLTAGTPVAGNFETGNFSTFLSTEFTTASENSAVGLVVVADSTGNLVGVPVLTDNPGFVATPENNNEGAPILDSTVSDDPAIAFQGITWIGQETFPVPGFGNVTALLVNNGAGTNPVTFSGGGFTTGTAVNITGAVADVNNALSGDLLSIQGGTGAVYAVAAGDGQLELGVAAPSVTSTESLTFSVAQQITVPLPVGNITPTSLTVLNVSTNQNNTGIDQQVLVIGTNVGLVVEIPILNGPNGSVGGLNPLTVFTFTTPDGQPVTGLGSSLLFDSVNNGGTTNEESVLTVVTPGVGLGQDVFGYTTNLTGGSTLIFSDEQGQANAVSVGSPATSGNANPAMFSNGF